jgi:crossover junction endodeoxyribonuclease RuvC
MVMKVARRCLGVDPGSIACGWAIVEQKNNKLSLVDSGVVRSKSNEPFPKRCLKIHKALAQAIQTQEPTFMAVESPFVEKNAATAIKLGQIRGAILLTGSLFGLEVGDYNPMQIKKAVSGYGWAGKDQVGKMVKLILGLKEQLPSDAADAAAVAIAHLMATRR